MKVQVIKLSELAAKMLTRWDKILSQREANYKKVFATDAFRGVCWTAPL